MDTTVQEKAIAFPTDARLYHKMRVRLVAEAEQRRIALRQSYPRLGKKALARQGRHAHARQMRRAARETRKLKTYLGRVMRGLEAQGPTGRCETGAAICVGGADLHPTEIKQEQGLQRPCPRGGVHRERQGAQKV